MNPLFSYKLSGRSVLHWLILTNVVYAGLLLGTIPDVMRFSDGKALLDMRPLGYSPVEVRELLTDLGNEGRNRYLYTQIPLDMVYPGLFAISYCLLMVFLLRQFSSVHLGLWSLCYLPILAGLSDYAENFAIILMLNSFPDFSDYLAALSNVFSLAKSFFSTVYFTALILVALLLGMQYLQKKRSYSESKE
ncbi:MAG: hypothetical protein AAFU64_12495 [Bacteroidota bacterium]